jgi:hypothetical protein
MSNPQSVRVSQLAQPCRAGRLRFDLEHVLFGLVLLWTFLSCCFPLYDTDFWWHLRTGELILERGELPTVDWYTFMDWDRPWIDLHWGFQLLITGLYRLGGSTLVILAKAAILTSAVGIAWSAAGRNLPTWMKALLWFPAIVAISGRGYERPEILSQLFLAGWLWVVHRLSERPRLIWLLPVLQVFWINCHALFILGLVVGACYAVDRLAREGARGRWGLAAPPAEPDLRLVMWVGLAALLASLCNPYFEEGALFPLELYRKFSVEQDFYSARIGEFSRPVDFAYRLGVKAFLNIYFVAEAGLWCLAALSFVWLACFRRWNLMRLLLFAGFSHLAWEATRNTNIFALVAAVVLCANCDEALSARGPVLATGRRWPRASFAVGALLIAISLSVVTGQWNRYAEKNKPFGFGELPGWYAHAACRFAGQPGFPNHAYIAHIGQAGVYIYHNGPSHRVFMDGRLEVCSRKTFEQFEEIQRRMVRGDRTWELLLPRDREGRTPVIILDCYVSRMEINALLQTPGWRLVFADPAATVFLEEGLADELEIPAASIEPALRPPGL